MSSKNDGATLDQESEKEKKRKFKSTLTTKLSNGELIVNERKHARTTCGCETQYDLEHLMKSVRALIGTNKEIWDRCKENKVNSQITGIETMMFLGTDDHDNRIQIRRISYEEVTIRSKESHNIIDEVHCLRPRGNDNTVIEVISRPKLTIFDFKAPPKLPQSWTDTFAGHGEQTGLEFDYEEYFKRALILNDDVLVSYLASFLTHLEDMHVFLGNIETWLCEGNSNLAFLNDLFCKNVEIQDIHDSLCCKGEGTELVFSSICVKCFHPLHAHDTGRYYCPNPKMTKSEVDSILDDSSSGELYPSKINCFCVVPTTNCCTLTSGDATSMRDDATSSDDISLDSLSSEQRGTFYDPIPTLFFTANTSKCDQLDLSFDLNIRTERNRLQFMIPFLKLYNTDSGVSEFVCAIRGSDVGVSVGEIVCANGDSDVGENVGEIVCANGGSDVGESIGEV